MGRPANRVNYIASEFTVRDLASAQRFSRLCTQPQRGPAVRRIRPQRVNLLARWSGLSTVAASAATSARVRLVSTSVRIASHRLVSVGTKAVKAPQQPGRGNVQFVHVNS